MRIFCEPGAIAERLELDHATTTVHSWLCQLCSGPALMIINPAWKRGRAGWAARSDPDFWLEPIWPHFYRSFKQLISVDTGTHHFSVSADGCITFHWTVRSWIIVHSWDCTSPSSLPGVSGQAAPYSKDRMRIFCEPGAIAERLELDHATTTVHSWLCQLCSGPALMIINPDHRHWLWEKITADKPKRIPPVVCVGLREQIITSTSAPLRPLWAEQTHSSPSAQHQHQASSSCPSEPVLRQNAQNLPQRARM